MRTRKVIVLSALASILLLALGATTASAHRGGPFLGKGTDLTAAAAKELGVSTDALKKAILDDANARIDKAVKDGKLDEDQAADLKDDLAGHIQLAVPLTTATGVARNLKITKAKLDSAYRTARKADILARIDQAVKDGRITADQAKDMKTKLDEADLPGYKPLMGAGRGGPKPGGPMFGGPKPGQQPGGSAPAALRF